MLINRARNWACCIISKATYIKINHQVGFWDFEVRAEIFVRPGMRDQSKCVYSIKQIEMLWASRASRLDEVVWWQWGRIPGRHMEPKLNARKLWEENSEYSEVNKSTRIITTHVMEQSDAGVPQRAGFYRRRWWADDLQVHQEPEATPTNTHTHTHTHTQGEGAGEGGRRWETNNNTKITPTGTANIVTDGGWCLLSWTQTAAWPHHLPTCDITGKWLPCA